MKLSTRNPNIFSVSSFSSAKEVTSSLLVNNNKNGFEPSFKGALNPKAVQNAGSAFAGGIRQFLDRHLNKVTSYDINYNDFLTASSDFIGMGFVDRFSRKIEKGSDAFKNAINAGEGKVNIKEKTVIGKLVEGITYPFSWMFVDLTNASLRTLKKLPILKNSQTLENIINTPFLTKRANNKEAADALGRLSTIISEYSKAGKVDSVRKQIATHTIGKVGNYDTKDERAFNRLATGFVSSIFVGRDFYNLAMYEENNPDKAKISEKKRANRERGRIALSAFTTYSVLGALGKYINSSEAFAITAITGASLFSEVVTRLFTRTPLTPLTPEQAKKLAEKRDKKNKNKKNVQVQPAQDNVQAKNTQDVSLQRGNKSITLKGLANSEPYANMPSVFKTAGFNMGAVNGSNRIISPLSSSKGNEDNKNADSTGNNKKSPVTVKRILIAAAAIFALDVAYYAARSKSSAFNRTAESFYGKLNEIYNSATKKRLVVPTGDFEEIIKHTQYANMSESLGKIYKSATNCLSVQSENKTSSFVNCEAIVNKHLENSTEKYMDFGLQDRKILKPLVDVLLYPISVIKRIIQMPIAPIKNFAGIKKEKKQDDYLLKTVYQTYHSYLEKYRKGKISSEEFQDIIFNFATKKFNNNSSKLPNNVLAQMSRVFVTLVSSYFFINDFRNETLIQSKGEDTVRAKEVTNERIAQKVSNFFMNQMFMNFFNVTFENAYLSSIAGATAVATATEITNETFVRKSIGVPSKRMTKEEIQKYEDDHFKRNDFAGKYFRLMARLTGKKTLSEKAADKKHKDENESAKKA